MEKARGKNVIFYMEDELGRPIFMEDEKLKAIKKNYSHLQTINITPLKN